MRHLILGLLLALSFPLSSAEPEPYIYTLTRVNRLVDCDTYALTFNLGFRLEANYRLRLGGVNGPENNDRESAANAVVVQVVTDWIADAQKPKKGEKGEKLRTIYVKYIKPDPFEGRFIGDLLDDRGNSLSEYLRRGMWVKAWNGKGDKPTYNESDVRVIVKQYASYKKKRAEK